MTEIYYYDNTGLRVNSTKEDLKRLAKERVITPETIVGIGEKEAPAANVRGIEFPPPLPVQAEHVISPAKKNLLDPDSLIDEKYTRIDNWFSFVSNIFTIVLIVLAVAILIFAGVLIVEYKVNVFVVCFPLVSVGLFYLSFYFAYGVARRVVLLLNKIAVYAEVEYKNNN